MVRNYFLFVLVFIWGIPAEVTSQEIKIFKVADFDLKGKVKSCLLSTSYGKEEYEFNESGLLTKSVTRHSDTDYDISYYKYKDGILLEKRFENYRDNTFDNITSIAHFYEVDSTFDLKITEKIISYNKEFLDLYEYHYDADKRISKIVRSNNEGTDETTITYKGDSNTLDKTFELNGEVMETIQTGMIKINDTVSNKKIMIKKFIDGEPNTAQEEIYNQAEKLLSKVEFAYNAKTGKFVRQEMMTNTYDENGMKSMSTMTSGGTSETKEYIYQFDERGNWIKEVITPDNAYKTRKITYYKENMGEDSEN